jgi:hypothetical protein
MEEEHGAWSMVLLAQRGAWSMVHGAWCSLPFAPCYHRHKWDPRMKGSAGSPCNSPLGSQASYGINEKALDPRWPLGSKPLPWTGPRIGDLFCLILYHTLHTIPCPNSCHEVRIRNCRGNPLWLPKNRAGMLNVPTFKRSNVPTFITQGLPLQRISNCGIEKTW